MNIPTKISSNLPTGFREEDKKHNTLSETFETLVSFVHF